MKKNGRNSIYSPPLSCLNCMSLSVQSRPLLLGIRCSDHRHRNDIMMNLYNSTVEIVFRHCHNMSINNEFSSYVSDDHHHPHPHPILWWDMISWNFAKINIFSPHHIRPRFLSGQSRFTETRWDSWWFATSRLAWTGEIIILLSSSDLSSSEEKKDWLAYLDDDKSQLNDFHIDSGSSQSAQQQPPSSSDSPYIGHDAILADGDK